MSSRKLHAPRHSWQHVNMVIFIQGNKLHFCILAIEFSLPIFINKGNASVEILGNNL